MQMDELDAADDVADDGIQCDRQEDAQPLLSWRVCYCSSNRMMIVRGVCATATIRWCNLQFLLVSDV